MTPIMTVVGARPQFIKSWAVSRALTAAGDLDEYLVHTGQHHDDEMSAVFFDELGLRRPDVELGIHGGSHAQMTGRMLTALEAIMTDRAPRAVVVYGDTNSTLAGALAACKLAIPVVHVEAGVRSFNRAMPEEINRVITDRISAVLCCPTAAAVENLRREGIAGETNAPLPWVANVGDVMLDTLLHHRAIAATRSSILERLHLAPRAYVVVTLHRAENTAAPEQLLPIIDAIADLADQVRVVFPVHPRTKHVLTEWGAWPRLASIEGLTLVEPLAYLDFLQLHAHAKAMITDSGGVQKEAMFLGIPCLTVRNETEWPETVEAGGNRLIGNCPAGLAGMMATLPTAVTTADERFGSGQAAPRIATLVRAVASA